MNTKRKWMLTLSDTAFDWIKAVSTETALTGSQVIEELIQKTHKENEKEFVGSLRDAQIRLQLDALNEERRLLDEKIGKLKTVNRAISTRPTHVTA